MFFSIIVPVYNTEKYLHQCIDSILAQSFTDFELLLINDGSTDRSREICEEYSKKDTRVRVFHKSNGGVSSARNLGLENARGEWITFVDSDDTLPVSYIEDYAGAISDDIDLVMAKYQVLSESGEVVRVYQKYQDRIFSQVEYLKEMYALKDYQGYIGNKVFRHSLIEEHNIRFNEQICYNEDRLFIVQYVCASNNSFRYKDASPYNYYLRTESATVSLEKRYNPRVVTDFDALVLMKQEIERLSFGKELKRQTIGGLIGSYDWNIQLMIRFGDYCRSNHLHMLWGLVKNGAFLAKLRGAVKPIVMMFFPHFFIHK